MLHPISKLIFIGAICGNTRHGGAADRQAKRGKASRPAPRKPLSPEGAGMGRTMVLLRSRQVCDLTDLPWHVRQRYRMYFRIRAPKPAHYCKTAPKPPTRSHYLFPATLHENEPSQAGKSPPRRPLAPLTRRGLSCSLAKTIVFGLNYRKL